MPFKLLLEDFFLEQLLQAILTVFFFSLQLQAILDVFSTLRLSFLKCIPAEA